MQNTAVEVQHLKEKLNPVMKDIEDRLQHLELVDQERKHLKEKIHPVEIGPAEKSISNVSFTEEILPH